MTRMILIKYLVLGLFVLLTALLSSVVAMHVYDEEELSTLKSILRTKGQSPLLDLEQEIVKSNFKCEKFQDSCSGSTVLKIQGIYPYVVKIIKRSIADHTHEIAITEITGKNSLSPNVLFSGGGENHRYVIMEFLKPPPIAKSMTWLNINWGIMGPTIKTVRRLHNTKANFPPTTTIYEYVRDQFNLIEKHAIPVPEGYDNLRASFDKLMLFMVNPQYYKPCHFDLHGDNIFISDEGVRLIDWDCAGMGNIYLELAAISLNFRFIENQDKKMLKTYFDCPPSLEQDAYFFVAKTLCLGVYSVRELIRPYFTVFPPFSPLDKVTAHDYKLMSQLSSIKHSIYDDILTRARLGELTVGYGSDLEIGTLMLHEYIQRLRSQKMQNILQFFQAKTVSRKLIIENKNLYESYLRSLFLSRPNLIIHYYRSMK